jgi:hypothetical protein
MSSGRYLRKSSISAIVVVAAACSLTSGGAESPVDETPQNIVSPDLSLDVTAELDPENSLRAEVTFENETGSDAVVEVLDQSGQGWRVLPPAAGPGSQSVPLLGLKPSTTYTVTVTLDDLSGTGSFNTGPLPDDMPPIEVSQAGEGMAEGLTLFDVIPLSLGEPSGPTEDGYLIAVDGDGDVVWYYRQTHSIQDVRRTDSGNLLFVHHETGVRMLDVLDNALVEWSGTTGLDMAPEDGHGRPYAGEDAIRVDTDQMHHEVIEAPNGNLITLSRELAVVDGFSEPVCDGEEEFEGSYEVVTDTIVEFDSETGDVVNEWSLFDMVDPLDTLEKVRPSEFCSQYLADVYPAFAAKDWTHANAVVLDVERNALLVSVRHLDQIYAIRYQDDDEGPAGELIWRLGEGGDFTLLEGEWFLHQHAPEVLDDGSIMVYDNGNERPGTSLEDPDELPYSRAVQYVIDESSMTARQVWENRLDSPGDAVYAPFVGDADLLDNGTVLITHGGLLDPPAHTPFAEGVMVWARIVEVDYGTGNVLFDLTVKDPNGEANWIVYRAERIPTMYPDGYAIEPIDG